MHAGMLVSPQTRKIAHKQQTREPCDLHQPSTDVRYLSFKVYVELYTIKSVATCACSCFVVEQTSIHLHSNRSPLTLVQREFPFTQHCQHPACF
jgi:hypothetical protein